MSEDFSALFKAIPKSSNPNDSLFNHSTLSFLENAELANRIQELYILIFKKDNPELGISTKLYHLIRHHRASNFYQDKNLLPGSHPNINITADEKL